jgi:hypothetical protein
MEIDDFFNVDSPPIELISMDKDEYFTQSQRIFNSIMVDFTMAYHRQRLHDNDYPDQSVCDMCNGCGNFMLDGEETECFQNKEAGECYYSYFDSEGFRDSMELKLESISDMLQVYELK